MKLFNRNSSNQNSNLAPEIQAYAQAEHRERMGMAWLVGVVSLIVSLIVLAMVYFGGIWIYNKVTHRKKTPAVTTTETTEAKPNPAPKKPVKEEAPVFTEPTATSSTQTTAPVQTPTTTTPALVRTGPDIDL